jgi:hypothetical protein
MSGDVFEEEDLEDTGSNPIKNPTYMEEDRIIDVEAKGGVAKL